MSDTIMDLTKPIPPTMTFLFIESAVHVEPFTLASTLMRESFQLSDDSYFILDIDDHIRHIVSELIAPITVSPLEFDMDIPDLKPPMSKRTLTQLLSRTIPDELLAAILRTLILQQLELERAAHFIILIRSLLQIVHFIEHPKLEFPAARKPSHMRAISILAASDSRIYRKPDFFPITLNVELVNPDISLDALSTIIFEKLS